MDKNISIKNNGVKAKKAKLIKHLGQVNNLEDYVTSDWWKNIFNQFYLKTDADVVEDNEITKKEIENLLEILNPPIESTFLDVCCGQGRHLLELGRKGYFNLHGIDRSRYLIQKARERVKKEFLNINLKEGDARKLSYATDMVDYISILGNSFGYFDTVHDDITVLNEIRRVLKPNGTLVLSITDGEYIKENYQKRSWEWIDKNHFVCRERSYSESTKRLISREVITHVQKGVLVDQFYAERLYSSEEIINLLTNAEFSNIEVHGSFNPESKRNQDLGMMERQIIITAQVSKKWTIKKEVSKNIKEIIVIMGDPNKPDILKPLCVFDEDDHYTVNSLKESLSTIKKYNFKYLNNHDTLIYDLGKIKSKANLIFNLCDEGFENNATKELHVPALLETINIPYTGGGPQCLAYCYDKSLVRGIAKEMSIPVPEACFINPEDSTFDIAIGFPVILKPNFGDSSFGITQKSVAYSSDELVSAVSEIRDKFGYEKPILIEELLTGKDITVGIIGNKKDGYKIFPILEEDYSLVPDHLPKICGYEAKWLPDSPYWNIKSVPANLQSDTEKFVIECCLKLFERLECRDYARLDWRLDANGVPRLLEVNPNPGWCWDGHLAKMARLDGVDYESLLEMILDTAFKRIES